MTVEFAVFRRSLVLRRGRGGAGRLECQGVLPRTRLPTDGGQILLPAVFPELPAVRGRPAGDPRQQPLPHRGDTPCNTLAAGVCRLAGDGYADFELRLPQRPDGQRVLVRLRLQLQLLHRGPIGFGQVLPRQRDHRQLSWRGRKDLGGRRGAVLPKPLRDAGRRFHGVQRRPANLPQPL